MEPVQEKRFKQRFNLSSVHKHPNCYLFIDDIGVDSFTVLELGGLTVGCFHARKCEQSHHSIEKILTDYSISLSPNFSILKNNISRSLGVRKSRESIEGYSTK